MTTIEFITRCPCKYCKGEGPKLHWTCPYCDNYKTFSDELLIKCKKDSCHREHYIWDGLFRCGKHDEEYHECSLQALCNVLSAIGSAQDAPMGFVMKALKTASNNEHKFKVL